MRWALLTLATLMAACGARPPSRDNAPDDKSYVALFANGSRNSWVNTPYRTIRQAKVSVPTAPGGKLVLVEAKSGTVFIERGDPIVGSVRPKMKPFRRMPAVEDVETRAADPLPATTWELLSPGWFGGLTKTRDGFNRPGYQSALASTGMLRRDEDDKDYDECTYACWIPLASRRAGDQITAVHANRCYRTLPDRERPMVYDCLEVTEGGELTGPTWRETIVGFGNALIAGDGRVVLAIGSVPEKSMMRLASDDWLSSGRLVVLAAGGSPISHRGISLVDAPIDFWPTFMSLVEPWYMLLETHADTGTTDVHAFDANAHEAWHVNVPFLARQPAVDGTIGRVYISGDGLAAVDNGVIAWEVLSREPSWATSYQDGTLAVTSGKNLTILRRDGMQAVVLSTKDGLTIQTPPAIAADGSVWFATDNAIHVAR